MIGESTYPTNLSERVIKIISPIISVVNGMTGERGNHQEEQIKHSLLVTRILLFLITSAFYLAGPPYSRMTVKVLVVLTMLVATVLAQSLYNSWSVKGADDDWAFTSYCDDRSPLIRLIAVETVGIALLALPTGGLNSPFIWYALNPIIMASLFLPLWNSWVVLAMFLSSALTVSRVLPGQNESLVTLIYQNTSVFFVFILTTALAQVAAALYRRLGVAYEKLAASHASSQRSLEFIASLYQALEAFSSSEDRANLAEVLASYTAKLCDRPAACYLRRELEAADQGDPTILSFTGPVAGLETFDWQKELCSIWNSLKPGDDLWIKPISRDCDLVAVPIVSNSETFGILAYIQTRESQVFLAERKKSLIFLAELGGIVLERMKGDRLWARLLVSEEQNRISNEIHDGIAQYLFSMVCGLHSVACANASIQDPDIQKHLKLIEETAKLATSELRASIYRLSPSKRGESLFVDNLASYLDDLGRLNGVKVDLQAEGSEELISPALRKVMYRIVRESCSNAIRHGQCGVLKVSLEMIPGRTVLQISDDGCGFPVSAGQQGSAWKPGLGIRNMRQLLARFNGELDIESQPGKGTVVRCMIPKRYDLEEAYKEAVI